MRSIFSAALLAAIAAFSTPAAAENAIPSMKGTWVCDRTELLIAGQWTTVDYRIEVTEQRGPLLKTSLHWSLPKTKTVTGNQGRWGLYDATLETFGVFDWNGTTIDFVAYGDTSRRRGTLVDSDTMRLVSSESGNAAWVNRTVCRRKPSG